MNVGVSSAESPCCNRFSLQDGFLLDSANGNVWRFDERTKSFIEVPLTHSAAKQDLIKALLEGELQALKDQYAQEMFPTLPAKQREQHLKAFEQHYIEPLRATALTARL